MISSRMDRKISIQNYTEGADSPDMGEVIKTWSDLYSTIWAQVLKQSGREIFSGGKLSEVDVIFRIRYMDNITTKCRIVYDSNNYDIVSVKEIGRQNGLEIMGKMQE